MEAGPGDTPLHPHVDGSRQESFSNPHMRNAGGAQPQSHHSSTEGPPIQGISGAPPVLGNPDLSMLLPGFADVAGSAKSSTVSSHAPQSPGQAQTSLGGLATSSISQALLRTPGIPDLSALLPVPASSIGAAGPAQYQQTSTHPLMPDASLMQLLVQKLAIPGIPGVAPSSSHAFPMLPLSNAAVTAPSTLAGTLHSPFTPTPDPTALLDIPVLYALPSAVQPPSATGMHAPAAAAAAPAPGASSSDAPDGTGSDEAAAPGSNVHWRPTGGFGWRRRRQRIVWTPELEAKFEASVEALGGPQVAVPNRILSMMGMECLTRDHISSHLQKYRLKVQSSGGVAAGAGEQQQQQQQQQQQLASGNAVPSASSSGVGCTPVGELGPTAGTLAQGVMAAGMPTAGTVTADGALNVLGVRTALGQHTSNSPASTASLPASHITSQAQLQPAEGSELYASLKAALAADAAAKAAPSAAVPDAKVVAAAQQEPLEELMQQLQQQLQNERQATPAGTSDTHFPLHQQTNSAASRALHSTAPAIADPVVGGSSSSGGQAAGAAPKRQSGGWGNNVRMVWTAELHALFEDAVEKLGGAEVATPNEILHLMRVKDVGRENVKSHLQKYRLNTRAGISTQPPRSRFQPVGAAGRDSSRGGGAAGGRSGARDDGAVSGGSGSDLRVKQEALGASEQQQRRRADASGHDVGKGMLSDQGEASEALSALAAAASIMMAQEAQQNRASGCDGADKTPSASAPRQQQQQQRQQQQPAATQVQGIRQDCETAGTSHSRKPNPPGIHPQRQQQQQQWQQQQQQKASPDLLIEEHPYIHPRPQQHASASSQPTAHTSQSAAATTRPTSCKPEATPAAVTAAAQSVASAVPAQPHPHASQPFIPQRFEQHQWPPATQPSATAPGFALNLGDGAFGSVAALQAAMQRLDGDSKAKVSALLKLLSVLHKAGSGGAAAGAPGIQALLQLAELSEQQQDSAADAAGAAGDAQRGCNQETGGRQAVNMASVADVRHGSHPGGTSRQLEDAPGSVGGVASHSARAWPSANATPHGRGMSHSDTTMPHGDGLKRTWQQADAQPQGGLRNVAGQQQKQEGRHDMEQYDTAKRRRHVGASGDMDTEADMAAAALTQLASGPWGR